MDGAEYAEYEKDVLLFLEDMDGEPSQGWWSCPGCDCADWHNCEPCPNCGGNGGMEREPYFSWSPCDCCGSLLGGDREDYIGWLAGAREHEYGDEYRWSGRVCTDCSYYLAYGRLDDTAMIEIEASA